MNKCPKCGKMFEGNFCPNCGSSPTGERLCPNCKKKVSASAKFCAECGFTLTPQVQPKAKKKSLKAWIKGHKKLVILMAIALVVVLVLSIAIPIAVHNRHNGTYYLYENEAYNYEKYFILDGNSYTDEKGYTCDVEFDGDRIKMYAELLGMKDVTAEGTIEGKVLKLKIMGAVVTYAQKGAMHEHEFSAWTVQTPSTCTEYGTEMRACKSCEKTETRAITQLASHNGTWKVTKEATCTETGTKEMHCSVCGQDFSETLDKISHKGKWTVTKEATCSETGVKEMHCSVCGQDFSKTINTVAHKFEEWGFDENSHWTACSVCKKANSDVSAHQNMTAKQCEVCGYEYGSTIGLAYKIENGACTVTGLGSATATEVVIPSQYSFKPVTSIANQAFYGCSGLTSVIIPDSVTSIGGSAFYDCSGLTSVTIGNGVTSIGGATFYGCEGLKEVHISNLTAWCGIKFGTDFGTEFANPLYYAHHLFMDGEEVTKLVIPDSVTSIGRGAFLGCSGLTSVVIPDGVTSIGEGVFTDCENLTNVNWNAKNCESTSKIVVLVDDLYLCSSAFSGCVKLKKVIFGQNVKIIPHGLFAQCEGLTSITIPNGVTSIGIGAFQFCSNLTSITISDSVTSIGSSAFYDCDGLTSVKMGSGVTSIGDWAFGGCSGLTSIIIPNSVTEIGKGAFSGCSGLKSITIPGSVTSIGNYAFSGCSRLTSIVIPDSVTSIGKEAFDGCSNLKEVNFKNPDGWKVSKNENMSGAKDISGLDNPKTAAKYLTDDWNYYCYYYWKREG